LIAAEDTAFTFSLTDLKWTEGPLLPQKLSALAYVQLENGFLAVGSRKYFDSEEADVLESDTLFTFDDSSAEWNLNAQRLGDTTERRSGSGSQQRLLKLQVIH